MSNEIKELYELEQELQKILKGHNIPKHNKNWIPEKQFLKKQLEKKKYKSLKNIDFDTLIQFETDLIKEQEREIKEKLKVVNKVYKKLGKQTLKVNKAIKTFEYQIDLRIYKQYLDKDDKKIKRHWQFETDLAGNQYVIFRKFTSYKMKPSNLSFLRYTIGYFYNIHDDYNIVDAFRNSFFNSNELNFNDYEHDGNIRPYFHGFIIDNVSKIEVKKYKEPKFKDIKYKNDSEKGIYSPYTKYVINLNTKLFQDVFNINYNTYLKENYRSNCCLLTRLIHRFYDRFNDLDDKGCRRYKNSLTYSNLCKLLNIEDKEDNIGCSINDVMPFFVKYKLGFVVYNQFMKEIHSYKPENNRINIKCLK